MRNLTIGAAALALAVLLATPTAARAEEKMLGTVTQIDVAEDKKSAVAVLKDSETAGLVPIIVIDDLTLGKFDRGIIQVGDEIKCRYEKKGKKKVAKYFKKAAGGC